MKKCYLCKTEKELGEFGRNKREKDGLRRECRKCRGKYYLKSPQRIVEWNIQRDAQIKRLGLLTKGKKWSAETKKNMSLSKKKMWKERGHDYSISAFNRVFYGYRKKGLKLEKDIFMEMVTKNCFYCNSSPSSCSFSTTKEGMFLYNGLDRVNNLHGYEIGNVVTCCIICNQSKLNRTVDEFKEWIKRVYHNLNDKDKVT